MTGLRERKKQQTRETIVEAADRLFAAKGFHATTMEEIADAAGVSPGTLYNYYGTKNTVLLSHLGARVADMTDTGAAVLADPPADVVTATQTLAGVYLDRFLSFERELLRELFAAGFGPASDLLPELIRLDELLLDQLGALLNSFAQSGDLDEDVGVAEAAIALFSLLITQLIMYVSMEDMAADELRQAVDRHVEIAFSGLRAQKR
ncbi:MAG: TetR/AcrR family transcriptional regulator [Acidimicrobiia bacterium]|nr:TetR/AcrR family transcriptional regulator [Acidimicrobiia bacterium]